MSISGLVRTAAAPCTAVQRFWITRLKETHSAATAVPFNGESLASGNKLLSAEDIGRLERMCKKRKRSLVDFDHLQRLAQSLRMRENGINDSSSTEDLQRKYAIELSKLPNQTHPLVDERNVDELTLLETLGEQQQFSFKPAPFENVVEKLNGLRISKLDHLCPDKSYYFGGVLADFERCLVNYVLQKLTSQNFELVSVPESVDVSVLEACGMVERDERNQIYRVFDRNHGELALAGTSEITLAAYLAGKCFKFADLPKKYAAVSKCFRAEVGNVAADKGLYRVHEFTKIEMFAVTSSEKVSSSNGVCEESENMLDHIVHIQKSILADFGIHALVYDMPPAELGLPAFRKIDIEAWMPGRRRYGEVSSASNCTDYQASRLNITYEPPNFARTGQRKFCQTLNGTACAVPRFLIAFGEQNQLKGGGFTLPKVLQANFDGAEALNRSPYVMNLRLRRPLRREPVICLEKII